MDRGEVASFVEDATAAIADAPEMGTRNTQLRVVEPFLSVLGWDVRSQAVEEAYAAANGTVVDYALCPGDRPGVFVQVAGCEASLGRDGRDELVAAMRASNVDRGVYTNGRRYLLVALSTANDSGEGGVEQVRVDLDALPAHVDALRALHRETVAAATDGRRQAAASLVDADEAAVRTVTNAVVDVVDDDVSDETVGPVVEPLARRFLDAVVDGLAPGLDADGLCSGRDDVEDTDESGDHDGARPTEEDADSREARRRAVEPTPTGSREDESASDAASPTGEGSVSTLAERSDARADAADDSEYVLRFFEDGRSVGAVGTPEPGSAVAQAVQYLMEERGLAPRIQLPYAPAEDDEAFVHRDPVHPDGRPMASAIDLGGVYVCLEPDVEALRERVETLAHRSGLRVMFTGDWPELD